MNHQIVAAFLFSLSLGLPSYAAAGIETAEPQPLSEHDAWVERIATANENMARANERYAQAVKAYGQMRHRRRQRGERKASVLAEQEKARAAVTEAARQLDEVLEAARRAGVPPGWVREALAASPASAEQTH